MARPLCVSVDDLRLDLLVEDLNSIKPRVLLATCCHGPCLAWRIFGHSTINAISDKSSRLIRRPKLAWSSEMALAID